MELETLRKYEDHRLGHELCKDYLVSPEKNKESGLSTFLLVLLVGSAGLVVGHNLK